MNVDSQLNLLRLAARVDPILRQAVADIEAEVSRLTTELDELKRALIELAPQEANDGSLR